MSGTPRVRALSVANISSKQLGPMSARLSSATPVELLRELRTTVESNAGALDMVSEKILNLVEMLENSFVQSFTRDTPNAPASKDDLRSRHVEKMEKFLKLIPDKRLSKAASPFMINEVCLRKKKKERKSAEFFCWSALAC